MVDNYLVIFFFYCLKECGIKVVRFSLLFVFILSSVFCDCNFDVLQGLFVQYLIFVVAVMLVKHVNIIVTWYHNSIIFASCATPIINYCGHESHIDVISVICVDFYFKWSVCEDQNKLLNHHACHVLIVWKNIINGVFKWTDSTSN